jgi:hypothetical protein
MKQSKKVSMKDEIHYIKYNWSSSVLSINNSNHHDRCNGHGHYLHHSGYAIRFYFDDGYGNRSPSTTLDMRYGAALYCKTYSRLFTSRGLQLICARFVIDVLSGKVDRLIREQKKNKYE